MAPFGASRAGLMSVAEDDIPDSDVYLHDDWGDNKLQDREDSDTTTHNGVEGIYRPEWEIFEGSPFVDDARLTLEAGDAITNPININLSEDLVLEYEVSDINIPSSSQAFGVTVFADSKPEATEVHNIDGNGYAVWLQGDDSGGQIVLFRYDDGERTEIIEDTSGFPSVPFRVAISRTSSAEWELLVNGDSKGTTTDDSHTLVEYCSLGVRDDEDVEFATLSEIKWNGGLD